MVEGLSTNSRNFQNNRLKDLYVHIKKILFASVAILNKKVVVDFRYRMLAFRGAGGELPQQRFRGLTCPAIPAGVEHPSAAINFLSMTLPKDTNINNTLCQ
jgi:hypothetical protein